MAAYDSASPYDSAGAYDVGELAYGRVVVVAAQVFVPGAAALEGFTPGSGAVQVVAGGSES